MTAQGRDWVARLALVSLGVLGACAWPHPGDLFRPVLSDIQDVQDIIPPGRNSMEHSSQTGPASHTVFHASNSFRLQRPLQDERRRPDPHVQEDHYVFTSDEFPDELSMRPSVGNGHVATVLHGPWLQMNGLYNGAEGDSHRAAVPSPAAFNISALNPEDPRQYVLNVYEGVFTSEISGDRYMLTQRIYAHQTMLPLVVVEVEISRTDASENLTLEVNQNELQDSVDLEILSEESDIQGVSYKEAQILIPETNISGYTKVFMYFDDPPEVIEVPSGETQVKIYFLTSVAHTKEAARQGYETGQSLIEEGTLLSTHTEAWGELWEGGQITLSGSNDRLARTIWGAFYYILSSVPNTQDPDMDYIGLSPSGLPFGWRPTDIDYMGHIFWDQETWMYPPLLMFHPDIGRRLVQTRIRVMDAAAGIARDNGYEGLQFPWEGAFTGIDVCPDPRYPEYEHHITGDIAFAAQQYLYATHDLSMLQGGQLDALLPGIADFWASRTLHNEQTGQYEIWRVMGPDEWHYNVNNSVFTNVIAKMSMEAAKYAMSLVDQDITRWDDHIENMYIPFDEERQYHPEFDGYEIGTEIKQADVILLGYPLMHEMTDEVRRNDLDIYQAVTASRGPAMSWSMYAIGWMEMGDMDQANQLVERNFDHIYNNFQVWREYWSEATNRGAANFITGMGGFLQTIMNGYGGMRLRRDRLDFNMVLPPDTTEFRMAGIKYLGSSLTVVRDEEEVHITLTEHGEDAPPLQLYPYDSGEVTELEVGETVSILPQMFCVFTGSPPVDPSEPPSPEPTGGAAAKIIYRSLTVVLLIFVLCYNTGIIL